MKKIIIEGIKHIVILILMLFVILGVIIGIGAIVNALAEIITIKTIFFAIAIFMIALIIYIIK